MPDARAEQHADVIRDRIAAFTDEMTEMVARHGGSPAPPHEPDRASGDTVDFVNLHVASDETLALFAECERALRAAVGLAA